MTQFYTKRDTLTHHLLSFVLIFFSLFSRKNLTSFKNSHHPVSPFSLFDYIKRCFIIIIIIIVYIVIIMFGCLFKCFELIKRRRRSIFRIYLHSPLVFRIVIVPFYLYRVLLQKLCRNKILLFKVLLHHILSDCTHKNFQRTFHLNTLKNFKLLFLF